MRQRATGRLWSMRFDSIEPTIFERFTETHEFQTAAETELNSGFHHPKPDACAEVFQA